jgi:hypothetical protein
LPSVADTAFEAVERVMLGLLEHFRLRSYCLSHKLIRAWPVVLLSTIAPLAMAEAIDPHALFENRCGRCHDHAGDLARETLLIEKGELVIKKSGQRLLDFLPDHFGKLTADETSVLSETFRQQIRTGGLYQKKCRDCHGSARNLAERELILRNDQLIGRYTGADIKRFLTYHGRLSDVEQTVVHDMLVWHLARTEGQDPDAHASSESRQ